MGDSRLRAPSAPVKRGKHRRSPSVNIPMHSSDDTVHDPVAMYDREQRKQLEEAIRELVRLAVRRAELERFQQGYEDGKRRAVN
jgi:hypothetical protein